MAVSWSACLAPHHALASPVNELYSPGIQLVKIVRGVCHLIRCVTWGRMTHILYEQPTRDTQWLTMAQGEAH